jgi:hypothetical protein
MESAMIDQPTPFQHWPKIKPNKSWQMLQQTIGHTIHPYYGIAFDTLTRQLETHLQRLGEFNVVGKLFITIKPGYQQVHSKLKITGEVNEPNYNQALQAIRVTAYELAFGFEGTYSLQIVFTQKFN